MATKRRRKGEEANTLAMIMEDGLVRNGQVRSSNVSWYDVSRSLLPVKEANHAYNHLLGLPWSCQIDPVVVTNWP